MLRSKPLDPSVSRQAAQDILASAEAAGWTFHYAIVFGSPDGEWKVGRPRGRRPANAPNYRPLIDRHWSAITHVLAARRAECLLAGFSDSEKEALRQLAWRFSLADEQDAVMVEDWLAADIAAARDKFPSDFHPRSQPT